MNILKNYLLEPLTSKYFQFSGKASRKEFWYFVLFTMILNFLFATVGQILGLVYMIPMEIPNVSDTGEMTNIVQNIPLNLAQIGFGLATLIPSLTISVRRLHDIGKSGWWYLIIFIPLIGALILLAFFVMGNEQSENKYRLHIQISVLAIVILLIYQYNFSDKAKENEMLKKAEHIVEYKLNSLNKLGSLNGMGSDHLKYCNIEGSKFNADHNIEVYFDCLYDKGSYLINGITFDLMSSHVQDKKK